MPETILYLDKASYADNLKPSEAVSSTDNKVIVSMSKEDQGIKYGFMGFKEFTLINSVIITKAQLRIRHGSFYGYLGYYLHGLLSKPQSRKTLTWDNKPNFSNAYQYVKTPTVSPDYLLDLDLDIKLKNILSNGIGVRLGYFPDSGVSSLLVYANETEQQTYLKLQYTEALLKANNITSSNVISNGTSGVKITWNNILETPGLFLGEAKQVSYEVEYRTTTTGTVNKITKITEERECSIFIEAEQVQFRIRVSNENGWGSYGEWITYKLLQLPKVSSLEPNGIDQNVDNNIKVTWVSTLQDKYILRAKQNGKIVKTYTGTLEKEILIPAKTLEHGTTVLELDVYNTIANYTAKTTSTFNAYGTPNPPIQDLKTTYNSSKPTFAWTSTDQLAYQLQVLKGQVVLEDSTQVTGTANTYTCVNTLENNQTLEVRVRIKNRYNLWSEWSSKAIKIYFAILPTPNFTLSVDEDKVIVSCFSPTNDNFYSHEVYKSTGDGVWTRMALNLGKEDTFTDHTCASGVTYYYKVSAIGVNGGITDSDIKSVAVTCNDFNFIDVENMNIRHTLRKEPKVSGRFIREVTGVKYSGTLAPTRESSGEKPYKQFNMSFTFDREDELMFEKLLMTEILLFKDGRGNKLYGFIDGNIEEKNQDSVPLKTISFTFTQVNFLEKDIYDPKHQRKVMYLDGTYFLDGSLLLNGLESVVL